MQHTDAGTGERQGVPVSLAALTISKRGIGFGLAALILLGLFVLPLLARISPSFEVWQATLPVALTQSLNPGALSPGHTVFGMKCSSCHAQAFRAVRDEACTECHRQVAEHLVNVAPHAEAFKGTRCADCHPAHLGKAQAMQSGSAPCLSCHADSGKPVAEVRDFGTNNPSFHLTIPAGKEVIRIVHDGRSLPPEQSGLKYSHQLHLDKDGVKSPRGNTVLACNDCHRLDTAGEHFEPIDMEMNCQQSRCHKLRLAEPAHGVLKHGSERDALQQLHRFFARDLADTPREVATRCPSLPRIGNPAQRMLDCADKLARNHAGATLFNTESIQPECALCHEIITTGDAEMPWKIARVRSRHDWQKASFNHARHGTMNCSDCHDKQDSKLAGDISMPRIEKCRECHAGSAGASNKVSSDCESCHRFHRAPLQPAS